MSKLFCLKYQPTSFDDFNDDSVIKLLRKLTSIGQSNILLSGELSCGKSCLLKTIVKEYYKEVGPTNITKYMSNVMCINSINEQGINYYRNEVKTFCQTHSLFLGKKKIVIIDDIDFINEQSQQVFRNCIDKYSHNVWFICSCSNIHKVVENLQSRLVILKMNDIPINIYKKLISEIKTNEEIILDAEVEDFLINDSNNNVKNVITNMEKMKLYAKPITLAIAKELCYNISYTLLEKYTTFVLNNDLSSALNLMYAIFDKGYSVIDILYAFFTFVKKTSLLTEDQKYNIIPYICKYITMFYNIHEDEIELALFTNNLVRHLQL
tara:strand:+ start:32948 stop:33916 length:969 start_codon:yes stop_codon:yes gene_type:complete